MRARPAGARDRRPGCRAFAVGLLLVVLAPLVVLGVAQRQAQASAPLNITCWEAGSSGGSCTTPPVTGTYTGTWGGSITMTFNYAGGCSAQVYQPSTSYQAGNNCTITHSGSVPVKVYIANTAGTVIHGRVTLGSPVPPVPDWCATSDFADASAGFAAGFVTVRFKWLHATLPEDGWLVDWGGGTNFADLPTSATVDGSPGYFYGRFQASITPVSVQILASANGSAPGCSITIAPLRPTDVAPGGSTYGGTDPTDDSDCGWNPFCYIKAALYWAFVPDQAVMLELRDSWSTVTQNRIPFAFLHQANEAAESLVPSPGCVTACWPEWEVAGTPIFEVNSQAAVLLRDWRPWLEAIVLVLFLVPIGLAIFWALMPGIGGSGAS